MVPGYIQTSITKIYPPNYRSISFRRKTGISIRKIKHWRGALWHYFPQNWRKSHWRFFLKRRQYHFDRHFVLQRVLTNLAARSYQVSFRVPKNHQMAWKCGDGVPEEIIEPSENGWRPEGDRGAGRPWFRGCGYHRESQHEILEHNRPL